MIATAHDNVFCGRTNRNKLHAPKGEMADEQTEVLADCVCAGFTDCYDNADSGTEMQRRLPIPA